MEKYEPTPEEMQAAEENMTEEQTAASERREEAREHINDPHKEIEVDEEGMQLVGEEKSWQKDRK